MARKRAPFAFEPLKAARSTTWDLGFRHPPVLSEYRTQDDVNSWHAARAKAEENADWLVWGTEVWEPMVCYAMDGRPSPHDGSGILATVHPIKCQDGKKCDAEGLATRIAECVNACRGITDPVRAIREARSILLALVLKNVDADDPSILGIMARLHAPDTEELKECA